MPVAVLTSKGRVTIPKEIRSALDLKPSERVIIVIEGDHAVIKPLRGDILDIGGSIKISTKERPIDFHRVREEVKKRVAKKGAGGTHLKSVHPARGYTGMQPTGRG